LTVSFTQSWAYLLDTHAFNVELSTRVESNPVASFRKLDLERLRPIPVARLDAEIKLLISRPNP